ncbi:hypothetical protein [Formosa algae]|uniref:hypothetical protein n=1 Tax=Formosa algae TaxID=225843 RepID=UPI000CCDF74D|nr:hypothetical protein [Formosa algae]PNW25999.1 hypothetical protein BKP44_18410 [Formosa algae]
MENLDKNINDFKKDTLAVEQFLTGTKVSYNFFKGNYPKIEKEFEEKNRNSEEIEGMEMFKKLKNSLPKYETEIYTYCFINLIARTEAFLNDILETLYVSKNIDLTQKVREKKILNFSHSAYKKKIEFLKKEFDLTFPMLEKHNSDITELFSARNIILHNNGFINQTYLSINESSKLKINDKKVINEEYIKLTFILLIIIAKSIEKEIKEKMSNAYS